MNKKERGILCLSKGIRLLKDCDSNNIVVKGIFREDFSAKTFKRPEWNKLFSEIRKSKGITSNTILFVK